MPTPLARSHNSATPTRRSLWNRNARTLALLTALVAVFTVGCAVEPDVPADQQSEEALVSTQTRVVPLDEDSRVACREAAAKIFCTEAEARTALESCSRGGKSGRAIVEARSGKCVKGLAYPTIASCGTPLETDCSYYAACLEKAIPCGAEGYALGFGEKYCTAFRGAPLSPTGRKWAGRVMICLQRALAPSVVEAASFAKAPASATQCKAVFDHAFASHPACYTSKDDSVCFLPPQDLLTVLDTIGLREILTVRTGKQLTSTAGICIGQITERIFGFGHSKMPGAREVSEAQQTAEPTREELEAMLAEWKRIASESER